LNGTRAVYPQEVSHEQDLDLRCLMFFSRRQPSSPFGHWAAKSAGIMGKFTITGWLRWLGWASTIAMAACVVGMAVGWFTE
jgi:hypothetical protein